MTAQRNPPVDIGPSSPSDDCANNPVGMPNESARESGLLQVGRVVATSRLSWLHPFVDEEGFLRVGGRLENSELSTHMKHPVILPGDHADTDQTLPRAATTRWDHAYAGSSETAILGAEGTRPSEEGNLELFCLSACNGQTDPAENGGLAI
ncbi:hypothetical protein T01_11856 [Trichinella spiralis]|uniref:Uncharacterized protein n=1 Tax=Trichinella spiralis TaxID=6334 RepID=A0A0V1B6H8_TRISP|nr:hypothetical protein T01_11856 [Trichinella spiralis]